MRQLQLQCAKCDALMPHNQPTPNHVLHALVSLFLLGLWIPVWILIAIGSGKEPASCVKCGNRRAPDGVATIDQPAAPTSKRQLLIMGAVMAAIVVGLLIYEALSPGDWNQ